MDLRCARPRASAAAPMLHLDDADQGEINWRFSARSSSARLRSCYLAHRSFALPFFFPCLSLPFPHQITSHHPTGADSDCRILLLACGGTGQDALLGTEYNLDFHFRFSSSPSRPRTPPPAGPSQGLDRDAVRQCTCSISHLFLSPCSQAGRAPAAFQGWNGAPARRTSQTVFFFIYLLIHHDSRDGVGRYTRLNHGGRGPGDIDEAGRTWTRLHVRSLSLPLPLSV